ncbi:helix-turn-helix transcriptional regulator [Amycolatopsis azurea]|uniref:helix-turn-helix transcriptional regulator n=1 Tax=Amycolatopsis azurea TaxID=36819 RepID=UPI0038197AF9
MTSADSCSRPTEGTFVKIPRRGLITDREQAGHTQESLAAVLGVDVKTVRNWENGTYKPRALDLQMRLAEELRITRRQLALRLDPPANTAPTPLANHEVDEGPTGGDVRSAPDRPVPATELHSVDKNAIDWRDDSPRPGSPAPSVVHLGVLTE